MIDKQFSDMHSSLRSNPYLDIIRVTYNAVSSDTGRAMRARCDTIIQTTSMLKHNRGVAIKVLSKW